MLTDVSKAFTRESDKDEPLALPPRAPLPVGVKNYITRAGAERLQQELARVEAEASSPARDARKHQLQQIVASLVIADAPAERETVRFGARVALQRPSGTETYKLVGADETDLDRNEISWLSPLAKALLGRRAGETIRFRSPAGPEEIVVLSISYE